MSKVNNSKAKPTIFANNWDRLGGRVLDILNGYVLSKRLDCDFVFYWPLDDRFPEMEEHLYFFNKDFIRRYRVYFDPQGFNFEFVDFSAFTQESAKKHLHEQKEKKYFKNPNFFMSPKFLDDSEEELSNLYIKCAIDSLSTKSIELWNQARSFYETFDSIHGRYGDLLIGNFNQYVDPRKYVDTLSLAALVRKLDPTINNVALLSDSPEITRAIEKVHVCHLRPIVHFDGMKNKLNEFEEQYFELFIMASSRTIYASSLSAFSILASKIGGNNLKLIYSEIEENYAIGLSKRNLSRHYSKFDREIRMKTKARDLVRILQNDWKNLKFEELSRIVKLAQKSDPNYVLLLCFSAILDAFETKLSRSNRKMIKSEILARDRLHIHADPLVLALATRICLLGDRSPKDALESRSELEKLSPFQISRESIISFLDGYPDIQVDAESIKSIGAHGNRTKTEVLWQTIVSSDEKELLFALLKLLKLIEIAR